MSAIHILGVLAFLALALAQCIAGFQGITYEFGWGWAIAAIVVAFAFRFTLPLTIGAFFGALKVWGWHWVFALLLALPGLLFVVPGMIAMVVSWTIDALSSRNRNSVNDTQTTKTLAFRGTTYSRPAVDEDQVTPSPLIQDNTSDQKAPVDYYSLAALSIIALVLIGTLVLATSVPRWTVSPFPVKAVQAEQNLQIIETPAVDPLVSRALSDSTINVDHNPVERTQPDKRTFSPSFDCVVAVVPAEQIVCGNESLSELDRELNSTFRSLLSEAASPALARSDQLRWLSEVRDKCQSVDCLHTAYSSRIREIGIPAASK